jgi:hypothetical protein
MIVRLFFISRIILILVFPIFASEINELKDSFRRAYIVELMTESSLFLSVESMRNCSSFSTAQISQIYPLCQSSFWVKKYVSPYSQGGAIFGQVGRGTTEVTISSITESAYSISSR